MFGKAFVSGGVLPLGFPVQRVTYILEEDPLNFVVFNGSGVICQQDDWECYDEDSIPASSRGWLDFGHIYNDALVGTEFDRMGGQQGDANTLKDLIENGGWDGPLFPGTEGAPAHYYLDGDFIGEGDGAKESVRKAVCETYAGKDEVVFIPVFDYVYRGADMQSAFGGDFSTNESFYHLVGVLAARIEECSGPDEKSISGTFVDYITGEGPLTVGAGIGSDSGNCNPAIIGVTLWQ